MSSQLDKLKRRIPEASADELKTALDEAKDAILSRRYPLHTALPELPEQYLGLQLRVAAVIFNKRGAEGEKEHTELGVKRTYEGLDELLKEIVPLGRVIP